jgi:hypothetical protein
MPTDLTAEFNNLLSGKIKLPRPIEELRDSYRTAKPFPHVTLKDMFLNQDLDSLLTEMGEMEREKWFHVEQDPRERTARMRSAADMGSAGDRILSIVHSSAFLFLISEITGVGSLLPDPYLKGAGYAMMRRGDYFNVHTDRNIAYDTGLTRRLAMIIFLNKSWLKDYHGQLELWSDDGKRCEVQIEPLFNTTILFEVANPNFHGVPTPLACPADRTRQSFILYYHTATNDGAVPHTSLFAPRFYGSNRATWRSFVRDLTPPILTRALRRLKKFDL